MTSSDGVLASPALPYHERQGSRGSRIIPNDQYGVESCRSTVISG